MTDKVAIVNVGTNGYSSALDNAFDLIDLNKDDLAGRSVIIKPNLCDLEGPELGVTTDVFLVESLVEILQRNGCSRIAIVESDHWASTADEEFRRLGYKEMAERRNVRLINLSKAPSYRMVLHGKRFKEIRVPKEMMEYDFFITVPKLKTHADCYITCALKNQFGMNPRKYKSEHHAFLSQALFDLNKLYRPHLVVVDGNFVQIEENVAKKIGLVLVGTDPVAVDYVVTRLFDMNPKHVPYLKYFLKFRKTPLNVEILGRAVCDCLIETSFRRPQHPSLLLNLAHVIFKASEKVGEVKKVGKRLSGFIKEADVYLAGTPPHLLLPAMIRGYREFRARKKGK